MRRLILLPICSKTVKYTELYDVDVVVKPDENIKKGKFEIKIDKTYEDILEELKNKN